MAYVSLAGFIYFLLGLLYMDMRVDHKLLITDKPSQQDIRLAFIHYDIDKNQFEYYQYVLPILIGIAAIFILKRAITIATVYDILVIIISCGMVILFIHIIEIQQLIQIENYDIRNFDQFTTSNIDLVDKLNYIAMYHLILIPCCFIQLLLLHQSYKYEEIKARDLNKKKSQ